MPNFSEIAAQKFEDIKRPPNPPVGEYTFRVTKPPVVAEDNPTWDFVRFSCQGVQALTADPDDVEAYGGASKVFLTKTFMLNKEDAVSFAKTMFSLKQFLAEHLGVFSEGDSLAQAMANSQNAQFTGTVNWRPDNRDPGTFQAEIGKTAAA